jgi:hypothetical protein
MGMLPLGGGAVEGADRLDHELGMLLTSCATHKK